MSERETVAENSYLARAKSGQWGVSPKKGTNFVRVAFCIEDEGPFRGRLVNWDGYFTDETKKRTTESLSHAGCIFPDDNITDLTGLGDKVCQIVVEHERWTPTEGDKAGEEQCRARVAWVNAIGSLRDDVLMDDTKKKSFAASMKGLLVNMRGNRPAPAASPNKSRQAPPAEQYDAGNEDIPF